MLGGLAPLRDRYGYLTVAGLLMLEDFGGSVPGETVLIMDGLRRVGRLNIVAVVLIAVAAAVVGDNIGYEIGRFAVRGRCDVTKGPMSVTQVAQRWGNRPSLSPTGVRKASSQARSDR